MKVNQDMLPAALEVLNLRNKFMVDNVNCSRKALDPSARLREEVRHEETGVGR